MHEHWDAPSWLTLLIMLTILVVVVVYLYGGWADAAERARTATSYCTQQGPRLHGGLALWSEDGETWQEVDDG